jgi:FlaA1/EpsC-like NDP-sugar epimerase
MREIRALARQTGLPVKRIPAMEELLTGRAGIAELRDFTLEELLEREPVRTDHGEVDHLLRGRTVLVTGAAGSIGSELCRQIVAHAPDTLITVDVNENALFELEHELHALAGPVGVRPVLCNIRDRERLDEVFATHAPEVVFHAAAYKHVPVLEHFPEEAVRTNVLGTRHVAELAAAHGVERFVLISTDKAVRPTSVMGTSKRVAELVVAEMQERSATHFTTLRFGNVLGSNGSVMQVFRKQIARGGPVTVTHPEMRRYFMSIPEAVELVLFAAAMDGEGSTYVLDMGEQVRILDLARHFVRLCGLEPGRDIQIEFTGLRPGEKLYEELWTEYEEPQPTEHPGILRAPRGAGRVTDLWQRIDTLLDWAREGDAPQVIDHLRSLVPEYTGDPVCLRERPTESAGAAPAKKNGTRVELSVIDGVRTAGAGGRDAVGVRQR